MKKRKEEQTKTDKEKISKKSSNKKKSFYTASHILLECIPFIIAISMIIVAVIILPNLPEQIPTHWNAAGVADNYSARTSVFVLPIIFIAVLLLLLFVPLLEPLRENMQKNYRAYYAFKIVFSIFFFVLFIATLLPNFGYLIPMTRIVSVMIGILFIALGILMRNIKQNYVFGIRTPWALANEEVWTKTHRFGAVVFAVTGILLMFSAFLFSTSIHAYLFLGLIFLTLIVVTGYSYVVFRKICG